MKNYGIDVSKWQGDINWQKVKNAGIKFAMIRSGWGKESELQKDKFFEKNYAEAKKFEIPVGTYHYSYADSENDAILEAKFCLKNIAQKQLEYPVAFDIEDRCMLSLSNTERTKICEAFCKTIESEGYYAMIYCSFDWYKNKIFGEKLSEKYDFWLAHWYAEEPGVTCGTWQYSSTEEINGITGKVDANISYKNYSEIMKNKNLNGFAKNYFNHTVKSGDTLWSLSEKFLKNGSKYNEIKKINNLDSNTIYVNQILKIPR